jgi:dolichol-phosphate mannosyltransferase
LEEAPVSTATPRIWFVLPTYNELENLRPITEAILETVPQASVLIVDDNSPDGTGVLADELAAERSNVAVLHREAKQGLGRAYADGFCSASARGAEIVVQMDADFSHPVRFLPALLEPILSGRSDLVLGSRYVEGGQIPRWSPIRRFISTGGSRFARIVLRLPYKDLTGGFKAWRVPLLESIDMDAVHAGGYAFQIEMTFRAHRLGGRIQEVPITFEERREGASKMSSGIVFEALKVVLALRLAAARGQVPVVKPSHT